ncbi:hypothetical protein F5887DRAFT_974351 [Amanita rubescens]|nr:hypothetical protein F5887DRAFT_974351 [Amanita rubescens]
MSSQPFQTLYGALWNKPLDSILLDAPASASGSVLKYISLSVLEDLGLTSMNYEEDVLLIRKEYDTALDTFKRWSLVRKSGGVVVTGQPGIGKTIFLFYVLLHRLSAGLPTAFQVFDDRFFLFTETGAEELDVVAKSGLKLPPGTWALTNSGDLIEQPCSAFLSSRRRAWIIQATSPKRSRWYEWSKQHSARCYVMDCFPPNELEVLGQLLKLDTDKLLSYYWTWGPCARTCVKLVEGNLDLDEHRHNVSIAAAKFASDPRKLFGLVTEFNSDEVSHVLFFVRPEKRSADSASAIRAEVPTKHLSGILALAVARIDAAQQSMFFSLISSHPWTKTPAGWMFEKFVHIRLASTAAPPLTCVPADVGRDSLLIPVCGITRPLNGITGLREANKYALPFYWRPTSTSFTSIDGIICTDSDIILVQATVSSKHKVKVSGLDAIRNGLPERFQRRNWCLVFITSTEESAQALRDQNMTLPERWENLVIYSCTFMIGRTLDDVELDTLARYIAEAEAEGDEEYEGKENDMLIFVPRGSRSGSEDKPGEPDLGGALAAIETSVHSPREPVQGPSPRAWLPGSIYIS